MRGLLLIITILLGIFILVSGIKIVEKRMETIAEVYKELEQK